MQKRFKQSIVPQTVFCFTGESPLGSVSFSKTSSQSRQDRL